MKRNKRLEAWERNLVFFISLLYVLVFVFFKDFFTTPTEELDTTDDLWYDDPAGTTPLIRSK